MKALKIIGIILTAVLIVSLFAGCTGERNGDTPIADIVADKIEEAKPTLAAAGESTTAAPSENAEGGETAQNNESEAITTEALNSSDEKPEEETEKEPEATTAEAEKPTEKAEENTEDTTEETAIILPFVPAN